ncbi:MAG: hypothetical protein P9L92_02810 [Candidatus Electryonea clarkiae]|nr:hypothetical protein [Candidatus Electryonea clarkiae]MDP8288822.1 hypothetical protein [Candidatus Electryonea clarkiae]
MKKFRPLIVSFIFLAAFCFMSAGLNAYYVTIFVNGIWWDNGPQAKPLAGAPAEFREYDGETWSDWDGGTTDEAGKYDLELDGGTVLWEGFVDELTSGTEVWLFAQPADGYNTDLAPTEDSHHELELDD